MASILQFTPFASSVDAAFWQDLANKKLNVLKLSEASQSVYAYYATGQPYQQRLQQQQQQQQQNPPLPESTISMPTRFCVPAQGLNTTDDTR